MQNDRRLQKMTMVAFWSIPRLILNFEIKLLQTKSLFKVISVAWVCLNLKIDFLTFISSRILIRYFIDYFLSVYVCMFVHVSVCLCVTYYIRYVLLLIVFGP